jgi:glutamate 5-kinase
VLTFCYDKRLHALKSLMNSGDSIGQKLTNQPAKTGPIGDTGERGNLLRNARRVVVKLGTNVVAEPDGNVCAERLEPLVAAVAQLKTAGRQMVLVSSGAVGLGRGWLDVHRARTHDLITRQACAAVGQVRLMYLYERLFSHHGVKIAQVLLTEDDFADRSRSSNLRHTMEKLLKFGVVPIVNENDTVSTAELEYLGGGTRTRIFSDNDRLAALVTSELDANALVLLSNVAGLLRNPQKAESVIPIVTEISPELKALGSGPSAGGRGGMLTKLEAAEIAMRAGAIAVIADGTKPDNLDRVFRGEPVGTAFMPAVPMAGKRRWIAYAADVRGRILVNAGARAAVLRGKASLLWSGVVKIERAFKPMDVISIADVHGREFARGIANHSSDEENGTRNRDQGSRKASVLVTRDNIVVLDRA